MQVRNCAVDGLFYPSDKQALTIQVDRLLSEQHKPIKSPPKALIVPHAGYIYSGHAAAASYHQIQPYAERYKRVVLLGPSHRVGFFGLAIPSVDLFRTPLGDIALDSQALEKLKVLSQIAIDNAPHMQEHSLEVQLPFLQRTLNPFELVPIVVGEATSVQVSEVIDMVWGEEETLILASSDLSHYLPYAVAQEKDAATSKKIMSFADNLDGEEACGCKVLNGLLPLSKAKGLDIELLQLENSGDTAGDHSRVVGYGAYALH